MGGMHGEYRTFCEVATNADVGVESPGRFFVAHELKIILAYLLQNYEIKPLPERPKAMWFGGNIIPPVQVKIEVRRRKGTV